MEKKKSVLYVEDEIMLGQAVNDYFIHNPEIELTWIQNEKEIILNYKNEAQKYYYTFDLILIDRFLRSDMNGSELGRYLRKTLHVPEKVKIVMFTQELGADDNTGFGEISNYIEIMNNAEETTIFNGYVNKQEIFSGPSSKESMSNMERMIKSAIEAEPDDFYFSPLLEKAFYKWSRKRESIRINDIITDIDKKIIFLCGRGFTAKEISQIVYGNTKMDGTVENEIAKLIRFFENDNNIKRTIHEKYKNDHEFCEGIKTNLYPNEEDPKYIVINKMTLFRIAKMLKIMDDID